MYDANLGDINCYAENINCAKGLFGAIVTQDATRLIIGFGIALERSSALSSAVDMAAMRGSVRCIQGLPRDGHHYPSNLTFHKTIESLQTAMTFKFTAWNLCSVIDGVTPAMLAGIQKDPWSAKRLVAEALGVSTVPPSVGVVHEAKPRVEVLRGARDLEILRPAPDAEATRDAAIMESSYGDLRVIRIEHETGHRKNRRVRGIRWCIVECKCGAVKRVAWKHLRELTIRSCGCRALRVVAGVDPLMKVEAFGTEMTIGQLGALSARRPVQILADIRRGSSAEQAALGSCVSEIP